MLVAIGVALAFVFVYVLYVIRSKQVAEEEAEAFRLRSQKHFKSTKTMSAAGRLGLRVTPAPQSNFHPTRNDTTDNFGIPYPAVTDTMTQVMVTTSVLNEVHHHTTTSTPAPSTDYGSGVCYETSSSSSHDSSNFDSGSCSFDSGSSSFSSD